MHFCNNIKTNSDYFSVVATNSGLGVRGRFKSGRFLYRGTWHKTVLMFLHRVNNIEHNKKENIYTGTEVISHIPL